MLQISGIMKGCGSNILNLWKQHGVQQHVDHMIRSSRTILYRTIKFDVKNK